MTSKAGLWQEAWAILAQAWRPPTTKPQCQALREWLIADLSSLAQELGLELDTSALAASLAELDDQALLVLYSRLFLAPPHAAYIALGSGVDGELLGPYAQAMARFLEQLGLQLRADSHQRPDDLPILLEVASKLESEEVFEGQRHFCIKQLLVGLQPLRQSLSERAPGSPWYPLATLTDALVRERLAMLNDSEETKDEPNPGDRRREQREALTARVQQEYRHQPISETSANRATQAGIPPEAMLEMIANLEAQGLDASHLRGQLPADGWTSLTPPEAKQGRTRQPSSLKAGVERKR